MKTAHAVYINDVVVKECATYRDALRIAAGINAVVGEGVASAC